MISEALRKLCALALLAGVAWLLTWHLDGVRGLRHLTPAVVGSFLGSDDDVLQDAGAAKRWNPRPYLVDYVRAKALVRQEKYPLATGAVDRLIRRTPDDLSLYRWRAELHEATDDYEQVVHDWSAFLERVPNHERARFERAYAYYEIDDYESALADYERVVSLDEDDVRALIGRGRCYLQLDRTEDALRDFNRALRIDDRSPQAYLARGQAYREQERFENSLADFTRAIELKDEYGYAYAGRGWTHLEMEEYPAAVGDFTQAIHIDASDDNARRGRGWAHLKSGDHESALADFNAAIALDPDFANAYEGRAAVHDAMGNDELAAADRKTAERVQEGVSPPADSSVASRPGTGSDPAPQQSDAERLQGAWQVVSTQSQGVRRTIPNGTIWTFRGSRASVKDDPTTKGDPDFLYDIKLFPDRRPAEMHVTLRQFDLTNHHIYRIRGKTLEMAYGPPEQSAPLRFETGPGDNWLNVELRRIR